jgi:hypothetical protein
MREERCERRDGRGERRGAGKRFVQPCDLSLFLSEFIRRDVRRYRTSERRKETIEVVGAKKNL